MAIWIAFLVAACFLVDPNTGNDNIVASFLSYNAGLYAKVKSHCDEASKAADRDIAMWNLIKDELVYQYEYIEHNVLLVAKIVSLLIKSSMNIFDVSMEPIMLAVSTIHDITAFIIKPLFY